jgi:NAD(P)-dependent dehydrogenase (short-subunit alcohol dehydrogenase family)
MKIIITGAASGIGRAMAATVAATGTTAKPAELLLADRDGDKLGVATDEIYSANTRGAVKIVAATGDLSDPEFPAALVTHAEASFGGLDAVVSNAGALLPGMLKDLSLENYQLSFDLHARAAWLLGKAAHSLLSKSRGAIVATASTASEHPTPPFGTYSASKAALVMLVRQMALEWGPDGIRCNCVSPGPTVTGISVGGMVLSGLQERIERGIPLGKMGSAQDVANAMMFLLSPAASQITGVNLLVDGGQTTTLMQAAFR